jgi:hypothetical protein
MSDPNGYVQFVDDDENYIHWLAGHPRGYVVNSNRTPVSSYLVLHRASCKHINTPERTNWTTTGYIKTCSTDVPALSEWARRETGGEPAPCGACRPVSLSAARPTLPQAESAIVEQFDAPSSAVSSPSARPTGARKTLPPTISTGCPELDRAWATYATMILDRSAILIPDTDDDLTWHAFLGHSIDMQGFRAAEFVGIDPLTRKAPAFMSLKKRGIGVPELASLWDVPDIQQYLRSGIKDAPLDTTLSVLRTHGGAVGVSLAEAFKHFPWRKFHWSVRALLENSATLKPCGHSFRRWLRRECEDIGVAQFPPDDFRRLAPTAAGGMSLERALRARLERAFYMVGPAMSAYMLCDWQLWLWREGRTMVFANFKLDSFHEAFVKKFGRGVIPTDEVGFARWWLGLFPELPPRLANECIWLAVEGKQVNPW